MDSLPFSIDWDQRDVLTIFIGFASAILTVLIGRWLARLLMRSATRSMERAHVDPMVIRFAQTLIFFGAMAAVLIAALNQAGIHTTGLTALLAAAGVALGLAVQDTVANLASGVMILIFRPYRTDDFVEAGGVSGSVQEVQVFSTVLRTLDNIQVTVPNSAMLKSSIRNYSAYPMRRIDLEVSISYDDSIGAARELLAGLMSAHSLVLQTPAAVVEVLELGNSAVRLGVRPWVKNSDYWAARCQLLEQIKEQLGAAGVTIQSQQQMVVVQRSE
ncbi:MAG: mechanosensitive ion channel [Chloroflexales bacterium]|nr:mechanosensitive ion channel [Chloroflexales bacterium]